MAAHQLITLADLGKDDAWLLVQQACGIPDPKARSNFMDNTTTVLLFAEEAYPDRLCVTAAIRQMGGSTIYVSPGAWKSAANYFPKEIYEITEFYTDCVCCAGMLTHMLRGGAEENRIPLLNIGGDDARPMHALADIACVYQLNNRELEGQRLAWIGRATGTLHSLIEGMEYFPYTLSVCLPDINTEHPDLREKITAAGDRVRMFDSPEGAVEGAQFVCVGKRDKNMPVADFQRWQVTPDLMRHAADGAHILLGASPWRCIRIEDSLLKSPASLLNKQSEHRLRVTKRMLHWLYGLN